MYRYPAIDTGAFKRAVEQAIKTLERSKQA